MGFWQDTFVIPYKLNSNRQAVFFFAFLDISVFLWQDCTSNG